MAPGASRWAAWSRSRDDFGYRLPMRVLWLVPVLVACGKPQDPAVEADKLIAQVKARYAAMLSKIDAKLPACPASHPDHAYRIMFHKLVKLAGAAELPKDDPNNHFFPTLYESDIVDRYDNQFNPKSSTVEYATTLLAIPNAVVIKLDKYDKFAVNGSTFQPGVLHVRAVWFDTAKATPTCADSYDVINSEKVWAESGTFGPSSEAIEKAMHDDLTTQLGFSGPSVKI
jgi:hypothetical protein